MKTLTLILVLAVSLTFGQTSIRWTDGNQSRSGVFDDYGRLDRGVQDPIMLGIIYNGSILTKTKAYRVLMQEGFLSQLPVYTPAVPQFIQVTYYPWFTTDTLPTTEVYPYGYECQTSYGYVIQGARLNSVSMWQMMTVTHWRPWNPTGRQIFREVNPAYAPTEALRQAEREAYTIALRGRLVQIGYYIFPTLKKGADHWYWNSQEIAVDNSHWLATSTGGWKKIQKEVRASELKPFEIWTNSSIQYHGSDRLKRILGIY